LNIASFIAKRIAFNRQKSFSRFIIRLSIAATVISVAVMIVTLSFVNGFQETVSGKIFSFSGHIRIQARQPMKANIAEDIPITANDSLARAIRNNPAVQSIEPFATKYAILKTTSEMEGVLLKGVQKGYDFKHLEPFLVMGRWPYFVDSTYSREIVLSQTTAKSLQLKLADRIFIYFIRPDGTMRPDRLTVVGIYKTSIEEYDKTFALADIRLIQRLNAWQPSEIGGYEIFLKDYRQMDQLSYSFYEQNQFPQLWETKTVKELMPYIFDWLEIQNTNQGILITIMIIIALINLITCLIILVLERLRMVGILKALGAKDWTVQKIFLYQSAFITVTGIALGTALALGILWLQKETGFVQLKEEAYYMQTAVVIVKWHQVIAVAASTLVVSFLVLLIPSLLVRRIQPVKAIRFR
jgi:lipoprotein-releasing system permease protein